MHEKLLKDILLFTEVHAFLNKQHFYKQRQAEIGKKSSEC